MKKLEAQKARGEGTDLGNKGKCRDLPLKNLKARVSGQKYQEEGGGHLKAKERGKTPVAA